MGNSLHSDNPICPVNVIVPDFKFFNAIPKSPNPMPLSFEYGSAISIPQFSDCPSNPKRQSNSDFAPQQVIQQSVSFLPEHSCLFSCPLAVGLFPLNRSGAVIDHIRNRV